MDKSPYQFDGGASVPHHELTTYDNRPETWLCRAPQAQLERKFADDPGALAANLILLLGLCARASYMSDLAGADQAVILNHPSQATYASLLEQLVAEGQNVMSSDGQLSALQNIFGRLCAKIAAQATDWHPKTPDKPPEHTTAIALLAVVTHKHQLLTCRQPPGYEVTRFNNLISKKITEVSEDMFWELTGSYADAGVLAPTEGYSLELLELFLNPSYWQQLHDNLKVAQETGQVEEWRRLDRYGHNYIRWVKSQAPYVEQVRRTLLHADRDN